MSIFKHFPTVSMLTNLKKEKKFVLVGSFLSASTLSFIFKMHLSNGNNDKKSNNSATDMLCHSTPELGISLLILQRKKQILW